MQVEFTEQAKDAIREIYDYYSTTVNIDVAEKLTLNILEKALSLEKLSNIGAIEPNLEGLDFNYRFIVFKNYKIVFRKQDETIFIADIFDARQNPEKLAERNK
jgi:plasmid stabilization system protein ParE